MPLAFVLVGFFSSSARFLDIENSSQRLLLLGLAPRRVRFARPWTQASKPALTDSSFKKSKKKKNAVSLNLKEENYFEFLGLILILCESDSEFLILLRSQKQISFVCANRNMLLVRKGRVDGTRTTW